MTRNGVRAIAVVVGVAAAVAWVALGGLAWPARAFTLFLLVPLPALLLLQTRLTDGVPDDAEREAVYVSSAISIWAMAAIAMLAARFSDFTRADLWLAFPGTRTVLLAAAATVAAGLLLMVLGRLLRLRESALIHFLLPRTGSEKIAFAGLSVSAGIAEELVFRAFLIAALLQAGAPMTLAAGLSVAVFAVSHAYQGVTGVLRVAALGAILTLPILVTGSIYPGMIAHAALDVLAGIVLADWLAGDPDH